VHHLGEEIKQHAIMPAGEVESWVEEGPIVLPAVVVRTMLKNAPAA
jgi:hypothetical protein